MVNAENVSPKVKTIADFFEHLANLTPHIPNKIKICPFTQSLNIWSSEEEKSSYLDFHDLFAEVLDIAHVLVGDFTAHTDLGSLLHFLLNLMEEKI